MVILGNFENFSTNPRNFSSKASRGVKLSDFCVENRGGSWKGKLVKMGSGGSGMKREKRFGKKEHPEAPTRRGT